MPHDARSFYMNRWIKMHMGVSLCLSYSSKRPPVKTSASWTFSLFNQRSLLRPIGPSCFFFFLFSFWPNDHIIQGTVLVRPWSVLVDPKFIVSLLAYLLNSSKCNAFSPFIQSLHWIVIIVLCDQCDVTKSNGSPEPKVLIVKRPS